MNNTWLFILQALTIVVVLGLSYRPLGDYMAYTFTTTKDLKVERGFYRLIGVGSGSDQSWRSTCAACWPSRSSASCSSTSFSGCRSGCPTRSACRPCPQGLAFNTAISFVTNTNWQSYSPELTLGYTVQFAGLAVQNFVSAAVGIAVAIALVRGFAHRRSGTIGNFWVDMTRGMLRILLPLSIVAAIVLIAGGVIQNFNAVDSIKTVTGALQNIPGGPVASQEAIKELGNNGGGFFNANSAHPFENPTAVDEPVRDLPDAGHPVLPATHLRQDGRRQPPGLRDPLGDGHLLDHLAQLC